LNKMEKDLLSENRMSLADSIGIDVLESAEAGSVSDLVFDGDLMHSL